MTKGGDEWGIRIIIFYLTLCLGLALGCWLEDFHIAHQPPPAAHDP